jgi:hypothetical protein
MVLEEETKIVQSRNARTQYIVIPADMVSDSQYPFKAGERIRITIDPYHKMMIIRSATEPSIKIFSDHLIVEGRKVQILER